MIWYGIQVLHGDPDDRPCYFYKNFEKAEDFFVLACCTYPEYKVIFFSLEFNTDPVCTTLSTQLGKDK